MCVGKEAVFCTATLALLGCMIKPAHWSSNLYYSTRLNPAIAPLHPLYHHAPIPRRLRRHLCPFQAAPADTCARSSPRCRRNQNRHGPGSAAPRNHSAGQRRRRKYGGFANAGVRPHSLPRVRQHSRALLGAACSQQPANASSASVSTIPTSLARLAGDTLRQTRTKTGAPRPRDELHAAPAQMRPA
jgi:hypothetical protein